ncbi:MAG: DUF6147 family protein [Lachnospiraceae bacterium]|nr:DUF6147 family protein [Lachnospiraceae bacterium]
MKKIRKFSMAVFLLCMMFGTLHAFAADELLGTVVDGSLLTEETEVTAMAYPKARWTYLSDGTGTLAVTGTRTVRLSGSTTAVQSVDVIYVNMYLQRLVNGTWCTYYIGTRATEYNDYFAYITETGLSVEGGYYYRAKGSHVINENGTIESISSYTDGIWID